MTLSTCNFIGYALYELNGIIQPFLQYSYNNPISATVSSIFAGGLSETNSFLTKRNSPLERKSPRWRIQPASAI